MSHSSIPSTSPQRILVIKLRHHGDMLLITPVITTLHANYPDARIDVLMYKETESMLANNPVIHQCFTIDRTWKKQGVYQHLCHEWRLLHALRNQRYDLVINLADQWHSGLISRYTGAHQRLGFDFPKRKGMFWGLCHTKLVSVAEHPSLHTVEQNLSILKPLNIAKISSKVTMNYHPADEKYVLELLKKESIGSRYIVVHPSSRWFFKCWTEDKIARIINILCDEGHQVVITSAPDNAEMEMVQKILSLCHSDNIVSLSGKITLPQLACLIDNAELFIGVDSVPMHMAAALETPYVALFGPSKIILWRPWGGTGEMIWAGDFGTIPDPDDVMTNTPERYPDLIPVEPVLAAVRKLLK